MEHPNRARTLDDISHLFISGEAPGELKAPAAGKRILVAQPSRGLAGPYLAARLAIEFSQMGLLTRVADCEEATPTVAYLLSGARGVGSVSVETLGEPGLDEGVILCAFVPREGEALPAPPFSFDWVVCTAAAQSSSLIETYQMIKSLLALQPDLRIGVVIWGADEPGRARAAAMALLSAAKRRLGAELTYLGALPEETALYEAVWNRDLLTGGEPTASAVAQIAGRLAGGA